MARKKPAKPAGGKEARSKDQPRYEDVRDRLEEVVARLERGEGTLEESLAAYEEGVALVKAAHGMLDAAEKRLEVLRPQPDGTFRTEDAGELARADEAPGTGRAEQEEGE